MSGYIVAVGTVCADEYYAADAWPAEGSAINARGGKVMAGGMIPNAACVLAGYGEDVRLLDILNRSETSRMMLKDLEAQGVDCSRVWFDDALSDAKCLIFLTPGDRTIFVVDSGKPCYPLDAERLALLRSARYVYTSPHNFMKFKDFSGLARALRANGVGLTFDVEDAALAEAGRDLLGYAEIVFFNQYGFEGYRAGTSETECIDALFEKGVRFAAVTLGAGGCRCYAPDQSVYVPGVRVNTVDATGAGDTFNASFLRCLLHGETLADAARFANAAAAYCVTGMGARHGVRGVEAVRESLRAFDLDVNDEKGEKKLEGNNANSLG